MFLGKKIISTIIVVTLMLVSIPRVSFATEEETSTQIITQISQTVENIKELANSLTEGTQKGTFKTGVKAKINTFLADFSNVEKSINTLSEEELGKQKT